MQLPIIFTASILIWLMFLVIPWLWWQGHRQIAAQIFLSSITAWVLSQTIKYLFYTPRPYVVGQLETLVLRAPTDGAFPSSHTAAAFAITVGLWLHRRSWGLAGLITALAIGTARVLSNVHYPVDIVGGVILGVIVAIVISKYGHRIFPPHLFKKQ